MNLTESFRIALRGLSVNKLRSALTMLGIIIGVGAVITLMAVGQGVQNYITGQLQSIGTNLLFVIPGSLNNQSGVRAAAVSTLTVGDADALGDPFNVPDVADVAPEVLSSASVSHSKKDAQIQIRAVTPAYRTVRNRPVVSGSFLTETDLASEARVAVLGSRAVERLFDPSVYPVGETIKISNVPFKVIGVLESKGSGGMGGGNQDDVILVPLTTAQQRLFPNYRNQRGEPLLSVAYVQVRREDRMTTVMDQITGLLRQRHNLMFTDDDDFTVINQKDLLAIFGQITDVLTVFLGAIAGISLLVGGIGIMNIMLVSVTERTREIGLRKALGAKRRNILSQFLIESITLSLVGGVLGIALGTLGAFALARLIQGLNTTITLESVLLATGAATAIGLFFGIYPATRAARLNPIDALRYE